MSTNINNTAGGHSGFRVPVWHTVTSLVGLGPIPFTKVFTVLALVAEANRHHTDPSQHDPSAPVAHDELTDGEAAARARVVRRAQRRLDKTAAGPVEKRTTTLKALHAEINILDRVTAATTDQPIMGPRGERYTYADALQAHNEAREQITAETLAGSTAHQITPHRAWWKEHGLLMIDLPVFIFAMFGLLNVNYRLMDSDFATWVKTGIAVIFAVLGTVILAVVMRTMGRRHRAHKHHDGTVTATTAEATWTVRAELAALVAVVAAAAGVMASRVTLEGIQAEANGYLIGTLAALFAALIAYAAYINYRATYDDGSLLTDRVAFLSAQLRQRDHTLQGLAVQRQLKVEQAGVTTAKLHRLITDTLTRAQRTVTDSVTDKAIHIARNYHHGRGHALPGPVFNQAALDKATVQATQLADHHHYLAPAQTPAQAGPRYIEDDLFTLLNTPTPPTNNTSNGHNH